MDARLHDYSEANVPCLVLTKPVFGPNEFQNVIGHEGFDKAHSTSVATFPRKRLEHRFSGKSTSGLTGYGLSEDVLDTIDAEMVFIIEVENDRVIKYHTADFNDATVVAYAPSKNECVIGDETMRVSRDIYHDRQRVVPVKQAAQTYDRDDITITQ